MILSCQKQSQFPGTITEAPFYVKYDDMAYNSESSYSGEVYIKSGVGCKCSPSRSSTVM